MWNSRFACTALLALFVPTLVLAADPPASVPAPLLQPLAVAPPPPSVSAVPDPDPNSINGEDLYAITTELQKLQWLRTRQKVLADRTKELCATGFGPPSICRNYIPDVTKARDNERREAITNPTIPLPPPGSPVRVNAPGAPGPQASTAPTPALTLTNVVGQPGRYEADIRYPNGDARTVRIGSNLIDDFTVTKITGNTVVATNKKKTSMTLRSQGTSSNAQ